MDLRFWKTSPKRNKELENRACECAEQQNNFSLGEILLSYGIGNIDDFTSTQLSGVFSALENISNAIAQLPIYITDGKNNEIEHYVKKLFYTNQISKFNLFKQIIWDIYLKGNAFLYIRRDNKGVPTELVYLKPQQVTINYNENNHVLYYLANSLVKGKIVPKDIIHFYKNGIFEGKSTISFGTQAIELAKETDSVSKSYFRSGCNVNGIIKMLTNSTDKQRQEIQSAWQNNIGKGKNGVAVMPQNVEYIKLGSDANSAQMLESRQYNITEIARFFNISPIMLGDLSKASYSTLEMVLTQFVQITLQPLVSMIQSELTRKLIPITEDAYINLDESYLIKFDKKSESEYYAKLVSSGILTINEARTALGFKPMPDCDKLMIPYTDITQNTISDEAKNIYNEQ
jgi:HK97 family phage portal protein